MSELTSEEVIRHLAEHYGIEVDDKIAGLLAVEATQLAATTSDAMQTPAWEADPFEFVAALQALRIKER